MSIDNILEQIKDKLRSEQIKNKCYLQGYEDAMSEAMFLLEKHKKQISCREDNTKQLYLA